MSGVKCIRLQPGATLIKLKDAPIGVVVSFGNMPIMNVLREKGKNPSLFISIISVNEVFLLFQFLYKINSLHL